MMMMTPEVNRIHVSFAGIRCEFGDIWRDAWVQEARVPGRAATQPALAEQWHWQQPGAGAHAARPAATESGARPIATATTGCRAEARDRRQEAAGGGNDCNAKQHALAGASGGGAARFRAYAVGGDDGR